jgi:hypothetical protein
MITLHSIRLGYPDIERPDEGLLLLNTFVAKLFEKPFSKEAARSELLKAELHYQVSPKQGKAAQAVDTY